eukprot:CAMPEP_0119323518 /NCGR_PEP_ID=MMETSP1333-20130426/60897_1 /TAXON_ID=418940 /ORGANISM="Scyphosphaera apsteinii, Strain RCC1455" /LENGTH=76 /DNA_ID=CAMNT_0007330987 /DNA_START=55 /DNA_END=285 /DNA_ORIENTATION=+
MPSIALGITPAARIDERNSRGAACPTSTAAPAWRSMSEQKVSVSPQSTKASGSSTSAAGAGSGSAIAAYCTVLTPQ